jgi:probable HAF family extracellular repeat protein
MKIGIKLAAAATVLSTGALLAACDIGVGRNTEQATTEGGPAETQMAADSGSTLRYAVTDIGSLGGPETYPNDVDDTGWVTGFSWTAESAIHSYRWRAGEMVDLGSLSGGDSVAYGVNSLGQVVGVTANAAQETVGFIWTRGTMEELPFLPTGDVAVISDLNDRDQVVGYSTFYDPDSATLQAHATIWQNRIPTRIGTLNGGTYSEARRITNDGQVMGFSDTAENPGVYQAFSWRNGAMTPIGTLGGAYSFPNAMNQRGQIVGQSETASGELHAFLWTNHRIIDLGTLGGSTSEALALNDAGGVVGTSVTASGATHAFLWYGGKMTDLGTLGGSLTDSKAMAVNNRGQIVGNSSNPSSGVTRPVLWQNGKLVELPRVQGPGYMDFSEAMYVTDRGLIIGRTSQLVDPVNFVFYGRTLAWEPTDDRAVVAH